jgi:hypothetical protein
MVYLPTRIWDLAALEDGGNLYIIFCDENGCWHELVTYRDGRKPCFRHYSIQFDLDMFVFMLPSAAVELSAGDFRVHWDGNKVKVVEVPCQRQP